MASAHRRGVYALLSVAIVAGGLFAAASVVRADTPPHRFSGTANLNGAVAANATINAIINDVICGSTTANSSGGFRIDVLSREDRSGCGINGAIVRFTVNGASAAEARIWEMGDFGAVNLNAPSSAALDVFTISGNASMQGQPVPSALVTARIGGVNCGAALADASGNFQLQIAGSSIRSGCGTAGVTVNFTIGDQPAAQTIAFVPGGQQTLNLSVGGSASVGAWLNGPAPAGQPTCPPAGNWVFLYWGGPDNTPIATAAAACQNIDKVWTNRQGTWLAFSPGSPANDNWDVRAGEGAFVRGK
jgi:hypothetical protein